MATTVVKPTLLTEFIQFVFSKAKNTKINNYGGTSGWWGTGASFDKCAIGRFAKTKKIEPGDMHYKLEILERRKNTQAPVMDVLAHAEYCPTTYGGVQKLIVEHYPQFVKKLVPNYGVDLKPV